jgi:pimeloyl-ACP methyl ester carboxylesterase
VADAPHVGGYGSTSVASADGSVVGIPSAGADWYVKARADVARRDTVNVEGADISFRFWGETSPDRPAIILVHGGGAHSAWWDHIGPLLATDRRVVALDLSGHGDSSRRAEYTLLTWAKEILAVSELNAPGLSPIIIAHSMGGAPALFAAATFPSRVAALILIDPLPHDVTSAETHARTTGKFGRQKVHPTRSAAAARFRVLPEQRTLDYVYAHIADQSVRPVDGGWSWKHDPLIYLVEAGGSWDPQNAICPIILVHPEHGLSDKSGTTVFGRSVESRQSVVIAGSAHHVMMDEPLALVACLRALLSHPLGTDGRPATTSEP